MSKNNCFKVVNFLWIQEYRFSDAHFCCKLAMFIYPENHIYELKQEHLICIILEIEMFHIDHFNFCGVHYGCSALRHCCLVYTGWWRENEEFICWWLLLDWWPCCHGWTRLYLVCGALGWCHPKFRVCTIFLPYTLSMVQHCRIMLVVQLVCKLW